MAQLILLLEYKKLPKVKVTVASNSSLTDLKGIAAEKFSITQPVTLEYFDADFEEWVAVGDDYKPPNKGKLRVTVVSDHVSRFHNCVFSIENHVSKR